MVNGSRVTCRWDAGRETLPAMHRQIVEEGIPVVSFHADSGDLEDLYMRISHHKTS